MKKERRRAVFLTVLFAIVLLLVPFHGNVRAQEADFDMLYGNIGEALMQVKKADWQGLKTNAAAISQFVHAQAPQKAYENEQTALKKQVRLLQKQANAKQVDAVSVKATLQNVAKAGKAYDEALHPVDQKKERAKLGVMLPIAKKLAQQMDAKEHNAAKQSYDALNRAWLANETMVRNQSVPAYGTIETSLAFIRIGFEKQPIDEKQIQTANKELTDAVKAFVDGKTATSKKTTYTLTDVVALLDQSLVSLKDGDTEQAMKPLAKSIQIWPMAEGEVRVKDPGLYQDVENKIPEAIGKLQSKQVDTQAVKNIIQDLRDRLKLLSVHTTYSFVDAMLILLREGVEAILIVTGLVAFLKRANRGVGQKWVWSGAVAGILASSLLAVLMVAFFSNVAGAQNRELIEGIIGIVAVIMMLSIGAWLHKRSNILHWNAYFEKNMGKAIATGSLFSMAMLSFLAIFREGAETVIFYIGMAPAIQVSDLLLGIGIALAILIVLSFVIIRYSTRIPLRPFFVGAAWLIYLLSFKMIGASMHALQIANILPTHILDVIPFVQILGVYPTVETLAPQLLMIGLLIITSLYIKHTAKAARRAAS